jgi:two-component system sensor histidine kinase NblS
LLALLNQIREIIRRWWSEFTLQTRLMAGATLAVSLLMSGLTFWAVNTIQQDASMSDTRFGRDLGLLLANNVAPLIAEDDLTEVASFSNRFYGGTSSVRYLLYADSNGEIFFGIPYSSAEVQNSLTIKRHIELPDNYARDVKFPLTRQHQTPQGGVTDVFVPLNYQGQYLGVLAVGINPNPTVVASSHLTRDVTIAVFVSIWAMVLLGVVFNALTITKPIKELLLGVKNIAAGNFKQRINLPLEGELGELIFSFNEMAERLERYEEQNIEELTAEKAKLETLVSTIADGAVLLNNEAEIILVNPTARRIFGWEGKETIGKNILQELPLSVSAQLTRPLQHNAIDRHSHSNLIDNLTENPDRHGQGILKEKEKEKDEFRITISEPTERTIRILLTQVFDRDRENVKGIAMTVQDITREAELNEAKSQFISNISHELRTPLFNIKSFIETLCEYGEDLSEAERQEFLHTANNETDRLTRLVNDVLDLSRLESSKSYNLESVEIDRPIEQTLRSHQLNAKDKKIEMSCQLEAHLPSVLGHYDLILQVLANLVGNALKFTESGGRVIVRAYQIDLEPVSEESDRIRKVRIEVSDTGTGIDPEDRSAIFDRFFRVENRVHTLEGTGLGLSIVRNIVERHRSRICVVSEIGLGSTFWFDLEIYDDREPSTSLAQSSQETVQSL